MTFTPELSGGRDRERSTHRYDKRKKRKPKGDSSLLLSRSLNKLL